MVKKYSFLISLFTMSLIVLIVVQIALLQARSNTMTDKKLFVGMSGMSDLALSSEAHFIRHRSVSDLFSIFSNSPTLTEYFPSSFVYHYSQIQRKNPARIELEK